MQKTTKIMLLIIGLLCIAGGVYSYTKGDGIFEILFAIGIGLILVGSIFFDKTEKAL